MPFPLEGDLDTGELVVKDSHSWSFLVAQDSDECSKAVALLLAPTTDIPATTGYNYGQHVEALAEVLDQGFEGGRKKALQIAKSGPRQAIYKHLLSSAGYEVNNAYGRCHTAVCHIGQALACQPKVTAAIVVRRVMITRYTTP